MRDPRRLLAWFVVLGLLGVLGWMQFGGSPSVPTAAIGAAGLVVAIGCLISLQVGALTLVVLTPFSLETKIGSGTALQVPTEPILVGFLGLWLLRSMSRGTTRWTHGTLIGWLLVALVACLAGLPRSISTFHTLKATLNATAYALFGVYLINNLASPRSMRIFIVAWLSAGMLLTLYSLGHVATGNFVKWMGYWWALPFFVDHGTFSVYLSFVCAMALSITIETEGRTKLVAGTVAFVVGAQVILSMTRGAWLGMVALAGFLMIVSGRRLIRPANAAIVSTALAGLVAVVLFSGVMTDLEKHTSTLTDTNYVSNLERLNRWYAGIKMFESSPLIGVGYGTYADNYKANRRLSLATDQSSQRMGVHSEYLRILAETGLFGMLAAAGGLFSLYRIFRRILQLQPDAELRAISVGAAGGLVTYLVHGLVNNYIEFDKAALPVWSAIGLLGASLTILERRQAQLQIPSP